MDKHECCVRIAVIVSRPLEHKGHIGTRGSVFVLTEEDRRLREIHKEELAAPAPAKRPQWPPSA